MKKILKILLTGITVSILIIIYIIITINLIFINLKHYSEIIFHLISTHNNISINAKYIKGKLYKFTPLIKIKKICIKLPNKDKILINKLNLKINVKETIYNSKLYFDDIKIQKLNIYTNITNIKEDSNLYLIKLINVIKITNQINNINISQSKINILNKKTQKYKKIFFNTIIHKITILKNKEIKFNIFNNKEYKTKIKINFKTNINKNLINQFLNNIKKKKSNFNLIKRKNDIKGILNLCIINKTKNYLNDIKIKSLFFQIINKQTVYFINIKNIYLKINNKNKKIKFDIKYININNDFLFKKKTITFFIVNKNKKNYSKINLYNKNAYIKIKNHDNKYYDINIKFIKYIKNRNNKVKLISQINFNTINYNNISYTIHLFVNTKNKFNLLNLFISKNKKIIHINTFIKGNTKKIKFKAKIEGRDILNSTIFINKLNIFSFLYNINYPSLLQQDIYNKIINHNTNYKFWIDNIINHILLNKIQNTNNNCIRYIKINIKKINIMQQKYENLIFILNINKKNKVELKLIKKDNIIEITFNKNNYWKFYIHCINNKININDILIEKKDINKCWLNNIVLYIKNIKIKNKTISFDICNKKNLNINLDTHIILNIKNEHKLIIKGNIYGKNIQNLFKYLNIKIPINNSLFIIKYNLMWNTLLLNKIHNTLDGIVKINLNQGSIENINFQTIKKIIKKIIIKLMFININFKTNNILPKKFFFKKILIKSNINNGIIYLNNILLEGVNENLKINGKIDLIQKKINIKTIIEPEIYKSIKIIGKLLIHQIVQLKIKFLNYLNI